MAYIYNADVNTPEAIAMKLNDVVVAAMAYVAVVDAEGDPTAERAALVSAINDAVTPNVE